MEALVAQRLPTPADRSTSYPGRGDPSSFDSSELDSLVATGSNPVVRPTWASMKATNVAQRRRFSDCCAQLQFICE